LDGAAAPESGTTQTASGTSSSDGRSKTPMINHRRAAHCVQVVTRAAAAI
jgi:hypothetical protein